MIEQERQTQSEDAELEINLGEIFFSVIRRWWIILVCLVVGVLAGFTYTKIFYTYKPIYYTTFEMSLTVKGSEGDKIQIPTTTITPAAIRQTLATLNSESFCKEMQGQMPQDYSLKIVPGADIYDVVALEQKATSSANDLYPTSGLPTKKGEVSVTYVYTTSQATFKAIISGEKAKEVGMLASKLAAYIPERVEIVAYSDGGTNNPITQNFQFKPLSTEIGKYAQLKNSNENLTTHIKNMAIFGGVATVLSIVVLVVVYLLDTRIKKADDIIRHVGVPVLGVIPNVPEIKVTDGKTVAVTDTQEK